MRTRKGLPGWTRAESLEAKAAMCQGPGTWGQRGGRTRGQTSFLPDSCTSSTVSTRPGCAQEPLLPHLSCDLRMSNSTPLLELVSGTLRHWPGWRAPGPQDDQGTGAWALRPEAEVLA